MFQTLFDEGSIGWKFIQEYIANNEIPSDEITHDISFDHLSFIQTDNRRAGYILPPHRWFQHHLAIRLSINPNPTNKPFPKINDLDFYCLLIPYAQDEPILFIKKGSEEIQSADELSETIQNEFYLFLNNYLEGFYQEETGN